MREGISCHNNYGVRSQKPQCTLPHVIGGVLCFHVGRPCVCPSVCPSVIRTSVRTSFPFDNIVIINGFHSNFANTFVPTMSCLGLLMGKYPSLITELWHLSMYKNGFWPLVPLLLGVS